MPITLNFGTPEHDLFDWLTAVGPLVVAAVGFLFAGYQNYLLRKQNEQQNLLHGAELKHQTALQKEQLKHSLYEKRLKLYEAVKGFVLSIVNEPDDIPGHEAFARNLALYRQTGEAIFLCGQDVQTLIQELHERSTRLRVLRQNYRNNQTPDNQLAMMDAQNWFGETGIERVKAVFDPYLTLAP